MRDSLYKSISDGDSKKITVLIKAGHDVNGVNARGESLLYYLFGNNAELNIKQYEAAFTLLELGADPLKAEPDTQFYKLNSTLLEGISCHHLARILLLSWYAKVDYRSIHTQFAESGNFVTLGELLQIQNKTEEKDGKKRNYLACIEAVINDAAAVKSLEAQAEAQKSLAEATGNLACYWVAAQNYNKIVQIYQKHHDLEDGRNYTIFYSKPSRYDDSATAEQLHKLFKKHYQQKKQSYLEQEFACYQSAERGLAPANDEGIKQHIAIIDRLIELSKILAKETELLGYLKRVAEVSMHLPDRKMSEASTVSAEDVVAEVSDDERTSLLGGSAMFGVRRRHPAITDVTTSSVVTSHHFVGVSQHRC